MAKEDGNEGSEEAKGIAQTFLGVLGVVDIVLGGLMLYALGMLHLRGAEKFGHTGSAFADNALLVGASALVGKLVCLGASFLAALGSSLANKYGPDSLSLNKLRKLVRDYQAIHPVAGDNPEEAHDAEDRALAYLEHERSPAAKRCAAVRDNAIFAYGSGLITVVLYIASSMPIVVIAALFLLVFGWLKYQDFTDELRFALRSIVSAQASQDHLSNPGEGDLS